MLTRDQVRVARLLDPLPESGAFAFAGGAAVIAHGLVQRSTVDLDYFASKPHEVARLLPAAEGALVSSGYEVHRIQIATETDFARLDVRPERGDPLGLDLAYDYRMRPTVETELGRTLHQEELAADKVLALFGRAEARDFRDVDGLVTSFGHERLLQLSARERPRIQRGRVQADAGRHRPLLAGGAAGQRRGAGRHGRSVRTVAARAGWA